jgi:asparagine synthase (glutamine-hydrolysing)
MCGIIGAIEKNGEGLVEKLAIAQSQLSHRGPDGKGIRFFENKGKSIALAHSRLAIIDLSELGHQPMASSDSRYWITFNGEIYNYKELKLELIELGYSFVSDTDTEVLLYSWIEWGKDCLKKFTGMFAFVLYDTAEGQIYCVRDAFGIKPFYYYLSEEQFCFASEIPALHTLIGKHLTIDKTKALKYLLRGSSDAGEDTLTEEVKALNPGCLLTISLESDLAIVHERWWWPSIEENKNISFQEATQKVRELFLKSVRIHMRSDVPIGAALSGGIDSSAVVCAMRYLEPDLPIHTFSYIASDSLINEEAWVDIVNEYVNAIPHKLELSSKDLIQDIDGLIKTQGEPFGSTSIYAQYRIFKLAKESGVTVTLEGQGADEMLAGYFGYPEWAAMSYVDKGEYFKLFSFLRSWSKLHGRSMKPILLYLRGSILTNLYNRSVFMRSLKGLYRYIRPKSTSKVSAPTPLSFPKWLVVKDSTIEVVYKNAISYGVEEPASGRRLVQELRRSLVGENDDGINGLLRYSDRNAMRFSLESRVPFLTVELAEFLLSLPESYLLSKDGVTKNVFREAMRGIVPNIILDRTDKIGFATPNNWLEDINNAIPYWSDDIKNISFLDYEFFKKEVNDTISGVKPYTWLPWRFINFGIWLNQNRGRIKQE